MTREHATAVLDALSKEFDVPYTLKWHGKTKRAFAVSLKSEIHVGPHCWRGTDTLLHEFAHLLDIKRGWRYTGKKGSHHGNHFRKSLWDVASFWYGDPSKYAWETEYKEVKTYGKRQIESLLSHNNLIGVEGSVRKENMFTIDKNVPIPKSVRRGREAKYNFAEMEVGDSFFVPPSDDGGDIVKTVQHAAYSAKARITETTGKNVKFAVRPVTENQVSGARVWRVE